MKMNYLELWEFLSNLINKRIIRVVLEYVKYLRFEEIYYQNYFGNIFYYVGGIIVILKLCNQFMKSIYFS